METEKAGRKHVRELLQYKRRKCVIINSQIIMQGVLMKKYLNTINNEIVSLIYQLIIKNRRRKVKNKNISIIANNCIGAHISGKLGLRYNSPTVNLQILPSQYVKFITNLKFYLDKDLCELDEINELQEKKIFELYGRKSKELGFPLGIIDNDIIVCFQHYKTFHEAKIDWDRRKK